MWWISAALITLVTVAVSMQLTTTRRNYPSFDLFDEESHYAYVVALLHGHLPAFGDRLTIGDRRMVDCLGLGGAGHGPALCGAPVKAESQYWADGFDYEAQQPPIGYLPYLLTTNPSVQAVNGTQATNAIISSRGRRIDLDWDLRWSVAVVRRARRPLTSRACLHALHVSFQSSVHQCRSNGKQRCSWSRRGRGLLTRVVSKHDDESAGSPTPRSS